MAQVRGERVGHWSENTNSSAVVGCRVGVVAVNQTAAISRRRGTTTSAVRTPVQDSKTSIQIHVVSKNEQLRVSAGEKRREPDRIVARREKKHKNKLPPLSRYPSNQNIWPDPVHQHHDE